MRPSRKGPRARETGAAVVEFGLVVPLLLLLVLGIIQYGLYFWAIQGGSDVARDAARRAAVGDLTDCTSFRSALSSQMGSFSESGATFSRVFDDSNPIAGVQVGERVRITVRFRAHALGVALIPLPDGGQIDSTAEARVENVITQPQDCV